MKNLKLKNDYPYIQAWGEFLGSFQEYIDRQKENADKVDAPLTTIYFDNGGNPITFDAVVNNNPLVKNYFKQRGLE